MNRITHSGFQAYDTVILNRDRKGIITKLFYSENFGNYSGTWDVEMIHSPMYSDDENRRTTRAGYRVFSQKIPIASCRIVITEKIIKEPLKFPPRGPSSIDEYGRPLELDYLALCESKTGSGFSFRQLTSLLKRLLRIGS